MQRLSVKRGLLDLPLRRLRHLCPLSSGDEAALRSLECDREGFAVEDVIDAPPSGVSFVLSGWACSLQTLADGRRQIFAVILPGDIIGDLSPRPSNLCRTVRAITAVQAVDATPLLGDTPDGRARHPTIVSALKAAEQMRNGYIYDHIVRLGARTAYERLGHLLLEIFDRLSVVGLTNNDQFLMPLTQERLGEMLGLSETHVNRMIRQLRQDRLLHVGPGWFALPDRERLSQCVGDVSATAPRVHATAGA